MKMRHCDVTSDLTVSWEDSPDGPSCSWSAPYPTTKTEVIARVIIAQTFEQAKAEERLRLLDEVLKALQAP